MGTDSYPYTAIPLNSQSSSPLELLPSSPFKRGRKSKSQLVRALFLVACFLVAVLGVFGLFVNSDWGERYTRWGEVGREGKESLGELELGHQGIDRNLVMRFPEQLQPTLSAQLLPDARYLMGGVFGGHTNQFISLYKLLYLGSVTNRITLIPTLNPERITDTLPAPWTEFYDFDRFWETTGVLHADVATMKLPPGSEGVEDEVIPCWSMLNLVTGFPYATAHNITITYWPLPPLHRSIKGLFSYVGLVLWDYSASLKVTWIDNLVAEADESRKVGSTLSSAAKVRPEEKLLFLDQSFHTYGLNFPEVGVVGARRTEVDSDSDSAVELFEDEEAWKTIGVHLPFKARVEEILDGFLGELLGPLKGEEELPKFISVHLRRGDFTWIHGKENLGQYIDAVGKVVVELQRRLDREKQESESGWRKKASKLLGGSGGDKIFEFASSRWGRIRTKAIDYPIIATTDEPTNSSFVASIREQGWLVFDHERFNTHERLGGFYPTILDAALLARGEGIVMTPKSTFSSIAGLRVKYWNGGPSVLAVRPAVRT